MRKSKVGQAILLKKNEGHFKGKGFLVKIWKLNERQASRVGNGILLVALIYLCFKTGIHSDDYDHIIRSSNIGLNRFLPHISHLPMVLYDFLVFYIIDDKLWCYDFFKMGIIALSFVFISKFTSDYLSKNNAAVFSILFIFYPTHDATVFWFVGQYLMITIALISMSHYLIRHEKHTAGFLIGLLGSFYSYASPPINFGLSIIFLLRREYKKFVLFVGPQILYIIYYYVATRYLYKASTPIRKGYLSDFYTILKNYCIQVLSGIDAFWGPSFMAKIYLSIREISLISFCIAIVVIVVIHNRMDSNKIEFNFALFFSFLMVALFSFGIFSLTGGHYTQTVFNLGNRVTIFMSLLVSYLLLSCMKNRIMKTIIVCVFVMSVFGLSDHWKKWNAKQIQIIKNISGNQVIRTLDKKEPLYVVNNHFSKLGEINHIEFLSESTINSIFYFSTDQRYRLISLKHRFYLQGDDLIDKKYNHKFKIDSKHIKVYDTETDKVIEIKKDEIEEYIQSLDRNVRHWTQLLDRDSVVVKLITTMIPRLEYLFSS